MKNKILNNIACAIIIALLSKDTCAQQLPTNTSPALPALNGTNASNFWSRAGNSGTGVNNSNNLFGTALNFNSPIYTITNGALRMKLNATFNIAGAMQYSAH